MMLTVPSPGHTPVLSVLTVIVVTRAREMDRDGVTTVATPIIPSFFDFSKEIEDIFPDEDPFAQTKELLFDYDLQKGVTLERDYDFYSDNLFNDDHSDLERDSNETGKSDAEMSASSRVPFEADVFPQLSQR